MSVEILLVDGCGVTRVIALPDDDLPPVFTHAHENIRDGAQHVVTFDQTEDRDPWGRVIYRQAEMGTPPLRFHHLPSKPTLRVENTSGE